jgi:hypothetical protein
MNRKEQIEQAALLDKEAFADDNYHAFKRAVEWADEHPNEGMVSIDKVVKYLKSLTYQEFPSAPFERLITDDMIEDFYKAVVR